MREVLKKAVTFKGRATRAEFWWWALFCVLWVYFAPRVFEVLASSLGGLEEDAFALLIFAWFLSLLAAIIPTISVTVRRLHDTGRSGVYFLLLLIPVVGLLILLALMLEDSTPHDNEYGLAP